MLRSAKRPRKPVQCTFEGCTRPVLEAGTLGLYMCPEHDLDARATLERGRKLKNKRDIRKTPAVRTVDESKRAGQLGKRAGQLDKRVMGTADRIKAERVITWLTPRERELILAEPPRLPIGTWAITLGVRHVDGTPTRLGLDAVAIVRGEEKIIYETGESSYV